jgi:thiamine-monophosphate kinase
MSNGEDKITAWFANQRKLSVDEFPIGIGDDMAKVQFADDVPVFITTDMLLDGVHFDLKKTTLKQVGYKAMAVNLSDCAAMATVPVAAVVSVALPKEFGAKELKQLHAGITLAGDRFGCVLVGGDITKWKKKGPFVISVAMLSRCAGNEPIKRSGAKVGDCICVTGSLGGSDFGRHLKFKPRIKEAIKIAHTVTVHSMIDISDGLSSDLNRICRQSNVGAIIYADRIPVSADARKSKDPLSSALNDGEDFELLFTLAPKDCEMLLENWSGSIPITKVGTITDTKKMQIKMPNGRVCKLKPGGYDHLR